MTKNKLYAGPGPGLPVTDQTWRLRDEGFIIDEKTGRPIRVYIKTISRNKQGTRLDLQLMEPMPISIIPGDMLKNVPPQYVFKTESAAKAAMCKKSFDVEFTISGKKRLKGTDQASVAALALLTPMEDIDWNRKSMFVTDITPVEEEN